MTIDECTKGATVKIKGQNVIMTVESQNMACVNVIWFDAQHFLQKETFDPELLEPANVGHL